jgi:hypothetical protein
VTEGVCEHVTEENIWTWRGQQQDDAENCLYFSLNIVRVIKEDEMCRAFSTYGKEVH